MIMRELGTRINNDNLMQTSVSSLRMLGQTTLATIQEQQDQNIGEQSMLSQFSMIEHFQLEEDDVLMRSYMTNNSNERNSFCEDYQLDSLVNLPTGDIDHSSLLINDNSTLPG